MKTKNKFKKSWAGADVAFERLRCAAGAGGQNVPLAITCPFGTSQGRKTFVVPAKAGTHVAVDSRLRGNDGRFSWLFAGRRPMETGPTQQGLRQPEWHG